MRSVRRNAVILLVFFILHLSVTVLFSLLFAFTISLYNMFYIDSMSIITDISFVFLFILLLLHILAALILIFNVIFHIICYICFSERFMLDVPQY